MMNPIIEKIKGATIKTTESKILRSTLPSLVFILVIFLLLTSVSFAIGASCTSDTNCPLGEICNATGTCQECTTSAECVKKTFEKAGVSNPWAVIATLAVAISILGSGIVYVIGHAFEIKSIKQVGKAELMQALASLLLVALLIGVEWSEMTLISTIEKQTGIFTAAIYQPGEFAQKAKAGETLLYNPFTVSNAFLNNIIHCAQNMYTKNLRTSASAEKLANLQIKIELGSLTKAFFYGGELFRYRLWRQIAKLEYIGDELTWLMVMLYAQVNLLKFIETSMFTVFLPIGIVLRAFPPTRGAGAVLIAIAIGLYVVFPLSYVVLLTGTPSKIEGCEVGVSVPAEAVIAEQQLLTTCPISTDAPAKVASAAMEDLNAYSKVSAKVDSGVSAIRYLAYLYLLISIGATFIFVRSISGMLGADISDLGRSMFKML